MRKELSSKPLNKSEYISKCMTDTQLRFYTDALMLIKGAQEAHVEVHAWSISDVISMFPFPSSTGGKRLSHRKTMQS